MRLLSHILGAGFLLFTEMSYWTPVVMAINKEGDAANFEYVAWDAAKMTATIEDVVLEKGSSGSNNSTDVLFLHTPKATPEASYKDEWIYYRNWGGQHWKAKCRAQMSLSGDVSFTFQHFRWDLDNMDREDQSIKFVDWDGLEWELTTCGKTLNCSQREPLAQSVEHSPFKANQAKLT